MFLLGSIKAYLCPNMMNFDALDFSECRSEERISFFWGSVYILLIGSRNTNTLPRRGEDVITPAGVIILPFAGTFGLHFNDSKHIFSPRLPRYRNLPSNYGLPLDGRAMLQAKVFLSSPQSVLIWPPKLSADNNTHSVCPIHVYACATFGQL